MIQQAVGQPVEARRLHKTLLDVELHQGNALDEIPGNTVREHGTGFLVILAHDKPHLGRIAPAACAAHALQEAGNSERRVDLESTFQTPNVNAQLQRCRGADAHERIVILHLLFGALPVGGGKISVMDQETVRFMVDFTVLPQLLADRFTFLPGIGEHKALLSPGMLEDVANARIRGLWRVIGGFLYGRCLHRNGFAFICLRRGVVKMLHGKTPDLFAAVKFRNDRSPAAADRKELPRQFWISDGGGQADSPWIASRDLAQPFNEAEGLQAPVRAQERMDLIDDDKTQIAEQGRDLHMFVDQQ